jgi:hypothetical protein
VRTGGAATTWGSTGGGLSSPPAGPFTRIAAGAYHAVALRPDGTISAWGDNGFGQCETPSGTFTAISAGRSHSYAVRTAVCAADLDGSSEVDFADIGIILLDYGPCTRCVTDLDGSGEVDFSDIALALLDYGPC